MRPPERDTIVAISSPLPNAAASSGEGAVVGRAILRLSGPQALAFAERVFQISGTDTNFRLFGNWLSVPEIAAKLDAIRGWRRVSGSVQWRGHVLAAQAYVMRSPHSYTREDIVELHVLALPWLLSALLEALLTAGARLAGPGEFTRRAFENGRIRLDQAEAVGALIASRSAAEARIHASRLRGHAHEWRAVLLRDIEELLALVELGLDFSDDDAGVLSSPELRARLEHLRKRLEDSCGPRTANEAGNAAESAILTSGLPRVLLLGPTNAGKSSLFNTLLGRPAAIVSPQPHTTRDTVEATLSFPGAGVALLIDSAGWSPLIAQYSAANSQHPALNTEQSVPRTDLIRQASWAAALSAARAADVILLLMDRSVPVTEQGELSLIAPVLAQAKPDALAVVWNKVDLPPAPGWSAAGGLPLDVDGISVPVAARFEVSSVDGMGIPELREFLAVQVAQAGAHPKDAYLAAAAAARAAARAAAEALSRASSGLAMGHGEDVVAVELREALHAFWQAEGVLMKHDAVTEATLDRIFSRFCIGK